MTTRYIGMNRETGHANTDVEHVGQAGRLSRDAPRLVTTKMPVLSMEAV